MTTRIAQHIPDHTPDHALKTENHPQNIQKLRNGEKTQIWSTLPKG